MILGDSLTYGGRVTGLEIPSNRQSQVCMKVSFLYIYKMKHYNDISIQSEIAWIDNQKLRDH